MGPIVVSGPILFIDPSDNDGQGVSADGVLADKPRKICVLFQKRRQENLLSSRTRSRVPPKKSAQAQLISFHIILKVKICLDTWRQVRVRGL